MGYICQCKSPGKIPAVSVTIITGEEIHVRCSVEARISPEDGCSRDERSGVDPTLWPTMSLAQLLPGPDRAGSRTVAKISIHSRLMLSSEKPWYLSVVFDARPFFVVAGCSQSV